MPVVLTARLILEPDNQIATLSDITGLVVNTNYVVTGDHILDDTFFTFEGDTTVVLTNSPHDVPSGGIEIEVQIAVSDTSSSYPYLSGDRLVALELNGTFELSAWETPPYGHAGGARRYKQWMDRSTGTTTYPARTLRICRETNAVPGVFNEAEWTTTAYYDRVNGRWSPVVGSMTAADIAAYDPHPGELIYDTTNNVLTIGGVPVGGVPGAYVENTGVDTTLVDAATIPLTSVLLEPGDWVVNGSASFETGTALNYNFMVGISRDAGILPSRPHHTTISPDGSVSGTTWAFPAPERVFTLTESTVVYLNVSASFGPSSTAVTAMGYISAQMRQAIVHDGAGTTGSYLPLAGGVISGTTPGSLIIQRAAALPTVPATVTPALWVVGGSGEPTAMVIDGIGFNPTLVLRRANGPAGTLPISTGDVIGQISARGYYSGATSGYAGVGNARFTFAALENFTDVAQGTELQMRTTRAGTTILELQATVGPGLRVGNPTPPLSGAMQLGDINAERIFVQGVAVGSSGPGSTLPGGVNTNVQYNVAGSTFGGSTGATFSPTSLTGMNIALGSDGRGDLYFRETSGALTRLGIGTTGYVLQVSSGLPTWAPPPSGSSGISGVTSGQIAIAGPANTITSSGNLSGNVVSNATLVTTIQPKVVTHAMMVDVTAGRLIGNPTGTLGSRSEIIIGTGLSISGGNTLNATASGGTPGGSVGQVQWNNTTFAGSAGATFDASSLKTMNIALGSDATGDIYYRNASGNLTRLPATTSGFLLQTNGAGTAPSWVSVATGGGTVSSAAANLMAWYPGPTATNVVSGHAAMTLSAAGSLTINRNTAAVPAAIGQSALWVNWADADTTPNFVLDAHATQATLAFRMAMGTGITPTATTTGAALGNISWRGHDGTYYANPSALLSVVSAETANFDFTHHGTRMEFSTTLLAASSLQLQATIGGAGVGLTVGAPTLQASPAVGDINGVRLFQNGQPVTGGANVASVSMTVPGSIFSVSGSPVTTSGTLALTVAGTSGGIPYFNTGTTMATSGALTQFGVVLGGGAGGTPTVTAAGTTGTVLTGVTGGAPTWQASGGGGNVTGSALTANQLVIGSGGSAIAALGSLGSTTTVLHGGAGAPTFGAIVTADITDANVTFAKIANVAAWSVMGNATVAAAAPANVTMTGTANVTRIVSSITAAKTSGNIATWNVDGNLIDGGANTVGTVTSVGLTVPGTIFSAGAAVTTSGNLSMTVAGTSGGIPYFATGATLGTSGALAANAIVLGGGAGVTPATMASNGTSIQVLHGGGPPTWGAVDLSTAQVTGNLPVGNLNGGTGATSSTYWRGDGTWAAAGGGGLPAGGSVGQVIVNTAAGAGAWNAGGVQIGTPPDAVLGAGTLNLSTSVQVNANTGTPPPIGAAALARFVGTDTIATRVTVDSFGANNSINLRRAGGTAGTPTATPAGANLGQLLFWGNMGGSTNTGTTGYPANYSAGINAVSSEAGAFDSTHLGGNLIFNTTAAAASSPTARMTISLGLAMAGAPDKGIGSVCGNLFDMTGGAVTAFGAPSLSWIVGASPNGAVLFVADRACTVATARAVIMTTGNAGSTLTLKKNNLTTLNSTAFALDGATGAATITLTTTASLIAGDYINITTSGTVTTGAGNVTVYVS